MLLLLWPKYDDGATGADPDFDPFGRKGRFHGPAQVLEPDPLPRKPKPAPDLETYEDPTPARPIPWYDETAIAEALHKIDQVGREIDDAQARFTVLQTLLRALTLQLEQAEEEEFALFLLLTH